jgi:serine protease Do
LGAKHGQPTAGSDALFPDAEFDELFGGGAGPVAVGGRAGGAGVEDAAGFEGAVEDFFGAVGALFSEGADANDPFGLEGGDDGAEVGIAGGFHGGGFGGGELVGGVIAAAVFDEDEWAVVGDEVIFKEGFCFAEALSEEAPEASAADFGLGTGEADDGAFGMFAVGFADRLVDAHPIAHGGDFTEGDTGLGHAKGAGIHADEDDTFFAAAKAAEVDLMRGPGVVEGLIDVLDGSGEAERAEGFAQGLGGGNECVGGHGRMRCAEVRPVKICKKNSYPQSRPLEFESVMQKILCFGILAAACLAATSLSAENVKIVLKNGAELRGEVLKDREDAVVLDLGHTVLTVPRGEISIFEKALEAGKKTAAVQGEDIYYVEPTREAMTVEKNVQRVAESVVQIQTASGLGSGFIINKLGYVITNQHVIAGEREITVVVYRKKPDGLEKQQFTKVKIIAMNGFLDVAILQIDDPAVDKLPFVPMGESDSLTQGQDVFAIGSPLGLERSVSKGIVSIRARESGGRWYIQSTTQINPGNSGGPLFNARGEVVGVNNMKAAGVGVEGLGFSIPSNVLKLFLKNREAFAFDPRNPNSGFRYLPPPAPPTEKTKPESVTTGG